MSRERALEIAVRLDAIRVEILAIRDELAVARPRREYVLDQMWRAAEALLNIRAFLA